MISIPILDKVHTKLSERIDMLQRPYKARYIAMLEDITPWLIRNIIECYEEIKEEP